MSQPTIPKRCSWCFGTFLSNHTPQAVDQDDGTVRWMHKVCRDAWKNQSKGRWPAQYRGPDRDE